MEDRLLARRAQHPGLKPNLRRRRGRIAIVTDSACALPVNRATGELELGVLGSSIECVPIPVMIDHPHHAAQIYPEASPELDRDLPLAVAAGTPVRTSRPSPGRLAAAYRRLQKRGYAGIVSVHLSAKLSGTYDAARLAAAEVDIPVVVVDTRQAGLAQGQAVLEAAITGRLGGTLQETAAAAERAAAATFTSFAVPSLEQLRRGGRINTLASILGSLLWIKPLLGLRNGEVALLETPRTWPRALERLEAVSLAAAEERTSPLIGVHTFGDYPTALRLAKAMEGVSAEPVPVLELPPGVAAHLGLGAVAVTVTAGT